MLMKKKTGLVVVDVQGKLARLVDESETLIANCEKLIEGAQVLVFLLLAWSRTQRNWGQPLVS